MPTKKSKSKKGKSGKKSTKFGRIYGSLVGKGYSDDEAAAIAYYYTDGKESVQSSVEISGDAIRETLSRLHKALCPEHIVKLKSGKYRLYSKKGHKNLGTFSSLAAAKKHEQDVEYFKHAESVDPVTEGLFDKLRGQLERKGYSKKYASKVADKVKTEKEKKLEKKGLTRSQAWADAGREK